MHQEISSYNDLNQQNSILGEGIDPHLQLLDQEKESHRLTKEELEKERSSHSATKKDLEDEIEKHIAIKVELEQIGTTAEKQPNVHACHCPSLGLILISNCTNQKLNNLFILTVGPLLLSVLVLLPSWLVSPAGLSNERTFSNLFPLKLKYGR